MWFKNNKQMFYVSWKYFSRESQVVVLTSSGKINNIIVKI